MRPGARAQAAIDILTDVEARKRPAADSIRDWGLSHRFAGAKDRAEIGDLVFGALRWRASSAFRMGDDLPRAWVLGAARWGFGRPAEAIEQDAYEERHAYAPPTEAERRALTDGALDGAPDWVKGDYPEWLDASLARVFGAERAAEGAALAAPAPLDLRVNRLKAERAPVREALAGSTQLKPAADGAPALFETPFSPDGLRIPWAQGRTFPWAKEPAFAKGWFEVQDEGSQIAALLACAEPGQQVADVCAGGGGKTLALAAAMQNKGQIYAFDVDSRRLAATPELVAARGRPNPPGAHPPPGPGRAGRSARTDGPRLCRCALHRFRHLAARARFEMAPAAGRARQAPGRAARGAGPRRALGEARRAACLCHLFGPARGE
jgi:16S rRNA (cytosine967-C5)-methyltransferase